MSRLIALNGFKQSGKDTSYELITDLVDGTVVRRAFADKLKVSAARALGFDRPNSELITLMDLLKNTGLFSVSYVDPDTQDVTAHELTGREYLQWYGTESHRDVFADSFWVDQVIPSPSYIEHCLEGRYYEQGVKEVVSMNKFDGAAVCVITDCRFPNEAQRVLDVFGEVWEIVRPGLDASDSHASEQPLPRELVTRTIVNDGSIADLRDKLADALGDSVRQEG
jgi:hypothetical protein